MKNKCVILLINIWLLLILSCGCSSDTKPDTQSIIKMDVKAYDLNTLAAVKEFNSKNKVQISVSAITNQQIAGNEYRDKRVTSILAGEGPDIILDSMSSFLSFSKVVESNVLCDLNQYISMDKDFKFSDFYTKVLDMGVIDSKRYYIPLNFQIPMLWSSRSLLENNNIEIDDSVWTFEDLMKIKEKFITDKNAQQYLFVTDFYTILQSNWDKYIDITEKKVKFNSDEFIHLLEDYKAIHPYILDYYKLKGPELFIEYMKNNSLLFSFENLAPKSVWINNTAANKVLKSQLELFLYPGVDGNNHPIGFAGEFISITNSCKNKKDAYQFIKLLLSEKFQADEENLSIPINKHAYKAVLNRYYGDEGNNKLIYNYADADKPQYTSIPLSDDIIKSMNKFINNMYSCYYIDANILYIVNEQVESFILGKQTSAQAANAIQNRVSIYLNE